MRHPSDGDSLEAVGPKLQRLDVGRLRCKRTDSCGVRCQFGGASPGQSGSHFGPISTGRQPQNPRCRVGLHNHARRPSAGGHICSQLPRGLTSKRGRKILAGNPNARQQQTGGHIHAPGFGRNRRRRTCGLQPREPVCLHDQNETDGPDHCRRGDLSSNGDRRIAYAANCRSGPRADPGFLRPRG